MPLETKLKIQKIIFLFIIAFFLKNKSNLFSKSTFSFTTKAKHYTNIHITLKTSKTIHKIDGVYASTIFN